MKQKIEGMGWNYKIDPQPFHDKSVWVQERIKLPKNILKIFGSIIQIQNSNLNHLTIQ